MPRAENESQQEVNGQRLTKDHAVRRAGLKGGTGQPSVHVGID
jgi:hypothetical protein